MKSNLIIVTIVYYIYIQHSYNTLTSVDPPNFSLKVFDYQYKMLCPII